MDIERFGASDLTLKMQAISAAIAAVKLCHISRYKTLFRLHGHQLRTSSQYGGYTAAEESEISIKMMKN